MSVTHTVAESYRSDLAYWTGLVMIWDLIVVLIATWLVPLVLVAGGASSALPSDIAIGVAGAY